MKLGHKLLMAPVVTAGVLLAALVVAAWSFGKEAVQARTESSAQLGILKNLSTRAERVTQVHADVYRTVALTASLDAARVNAMRTALPARMAEVKTGLTGLGADGDGDAELKRIAAEAARLVDRYVKASDDAIDLASVDMNTGLIALQTADEAQAALVHTLAQVLDRAEANATSAAAAADQRSRRVTIALLAAGLLAAGGAIALSWLMLRRIVAELEVASRLASDVAAGRLDGTVATGRRDEIGDLMRALGSMQVQLRGLVSQVRHCADSIAIASSEVALGNADLSQRTEQTAGALQETAASMEQLTGAVRQTNESARTADQLAATASGVAERGGSVVSQVVSTMNEIQASSRKIADIISVIDGIAFQTNILALNAAVEAARAGEQGRGFAVVAGEVRNLAQRSAEAAKEIKTLINASVERVEQGTALVDQAGETMQEIVRSIKRVTDIMGEISAASGEQSAGVAQVGQAVAQMDQNTQQNAALVEQSATAAESLKVQAQQLVQAVAVFKLDAQEQPAARADSPNHAVPSAAARPAAGGGEERRGPNRATNVVRPKFDAQPGKAAAAAPTAPPPTGTDGEWTSF